MDDLNELEAKYIFKKYAGFEYPLFYSTNANRFHRIFYCWSIRILDEKQDPIFIVSPVIETVASQSYQMFKIEDLQFYYAKNVRCSFMAKEGEEVQCGEFRQLKRGDLNEYLLSDEYEWRRFGEQLSKLLPE